MLLLLGPRANRHCLKLLGCRFNGIEMANHTENVQHVRFHLYRRILGYSLIVRSASSAVSPDEKVVVVANLYDGLDWYKIPDRTFSRSVPLRISHNVPIPVLLVDEGKTLLVGGTSGNVKVLDAHTAETIQTLGHDRMKSPTVRKSNGADQVILQPMTSFKP